MPTPLGDIFVRIGLKSKDFEKGLDKVQKASAKVFAGVSGAIAGISVVGAGFEKEITKVGALTGATGDTFKRLGETARSVAKETEFTAKQAAEGMGFFAMAGFSAEQSMAALRPATILATTGFIDLGRASDIVTNIMSGFGKGFDELDHSIDVLVKTATSANTSVDMMGESMSYVAPVARSFGISFEETAAAIGLLGDAGIQASRAGTNLRMLMTKLAKPTGEAADILERLGVNVFDANEKMMPMSTIFGQIAKSGMTAKETMEVFGPRAASAALILTQSMKSGEKSLESFTKELMNAGGTSEEIFERMSQTTSFQFNVLKSNIEEAALVMFDQFKPAVMAAIKVGQKLAMIFAQMDPGTHELIANVALLTAGITGLGMAFATAGKIFLIAFAPANLVILAIVAGVGMIAAAVMVVVNRWDELTAKFKSAGKAFAKLFGDSDAFVPGGPQEPAAAKAAAKDTGPGVVMQTINAMMADVKGGIGKTFKAFGFDLDNTGAEVKTLGKELGKVSQKSGTAAGQIGAAGEAAGAFAGIEFDFDAMEREALAAEQRRQDLVDSTAARADGLMNQHLDDVTNYQLELDRKMQGDIKARDEYTGKIATTGDMMFAAGQSIVQRMGKAGDLIMAGVQGFQSGGPIGAIIAIIVEVLMSLKSFMKIIDLVNVGLEMIFEAIDPILEPFAKLSEAGNALLKPLMQLVGGVIKIMSQFDLLSKVLDLISGPLDELGKAFDDVAGWFEGAANDIDKEFKKFFGLARDMTEAEKRELAAVNAQIEANHKLNMAAAEAALSIATFERSIKDSVDQILENKRIRGDFDQSTITDEIQRAIDGGATQNELESLFLDYFNQLVAIGFSPDQARGILGGAYTEISQGLTNEFEKKRLAAARISAGEQFEGVTEFDLTPKLKDLADATEGAADAANKATDALTNLPTGFKLAKARLASIDTGVSMPGVAGGTGMGATLAGAVGQGQTITIEEVLVQTDDPEKLLDALQAEVERRNHLSTQNSIQSNNDPGGLG